MIINHNMNAMNAHRNMSANTVNAGKSMEKLSSGLRINKAGDDAAGLAISEKMRGQIRGLDQASRNAQDGISMIQTAEGALNETHSIVQRMRELSVQASNDTNTATDRGEIQKEINQLTSEINRIGSNTEFNTQKLLNGNKVGAAHTSTGVAVAGVYDIAVGTSDIKIDGVTITYNAAATGADGNFKDAATLAAAIATKASLNTSYTAAAGAGKVTLTQNGGQEGPNKPVVIGTTISTTTEGAAATTVRDGAANLQIGANNSQQFTVSIEDMRARALGLSGESATLYATTGTAVTDGSTGASEYALDVSTAAKATAAISILDHATAKVSGERSKLGAYQNRLEHTIANLGTASENLTSAESRVRDVDMAKEMMSFSKNNILSQAAQAMLAQANQQPQGVLQLLR